MGAIAAALWLFSSAEDPQVGAHPALVAANGDPMATDGAGPDFAAPPSIDPSERIAGEIAIPSIAPPVLPPLPRGHLRIRAIDARSGLPVAGADVFADWPPSRSIPVDEQRERDLLTDPGERLARFGQRARTDAAGYAGIVGADEQLVVASMGELWASATVELDVLGDAPLVLRMERDESVTVEVVDLAAAPVVDMPIGLAVVAERPGAARPSRCPMTVAQTGRDGRAVVRHLQSFCASELLSRLEVYPRSPGLAHVRATLAPGQSTVRLVIPGCGSVRIRGLDLDGRELASDPTWVATLYGPTAAAPETGLDSQVYRRLTGGAGEATFPCVGLGLNLVVGIQVGDLGVQRRVQGPTRAGETVECTLSLAEKQGTLVGARLVDVAGLPLVGVQVVANDRESWVASTRTDAAGRLRLHLERNDLEVHRLRLTAFGSAGPLGASRVHELPAGAPVELGDVAVATGSVLASGVLVEECPLPPGFALSIEARVDDGWVAVAFPVAIAVDATFAIRDGGLPVTGPLRLVVRAPGCRPVPPIEFSPGQSDLRVVVRSGTRWRARLCVPAETLPRIDDGDVSATLQDGQGGVQPLRGRIVDGEWVLESMSCGEGPLTLVIHGSLELARLEGVQGDDGVIDPRLDPWDLRDLVRIVQLRAVAPDGGLVDGDGNVMLRVQPGQPWSGDSWLQDGVATLIVPRGACEACVVIDGWRPSVQRGITASTDVVLQPMAEVRLRLEGLPAASGRLDLGVDVRVAGGAPMSADLPEWCSPVASATFVRAERVVVARVAAACDASLVLCLPIEGDAERVVPCRLDPRVPESVVQLPEALRAELAELAARR